MSVPFKPCRLAWNDATAGQHNQVTIPAGELLPWSSRWTRSSESWAGNARMMRTCLPSPRPEKRTSGERAQGEGRSNPET